MGGFPPIYNGNETGKLDEKDQQALREAIMRELATNQNIRRLLREKTQSLYESLLKPKKP